MSRSDSEEGPDAKKRKIVRKNTRGRTIYCVHTHTVLNCWTINYYLWNTAGTKVISRMPLQSHVQCSQILHCLVFCAFENCSLILYTLDESMCVHMCLRACCFDAGTTKDECVGEVS